MVVEISCRLDSVLLEAVTMDLCRSRKIEIERDFRYVWEVEKWKWMEGVPEEEEGVPEL